MSLKLKTKSAIIIQSHVRGWIARRNAARRHENSGLKLVLCSVLRLQRWWRRVLSLRLQTESAIIIQSHVRGWIARRNAAMERHYIVVIQVRYFSLSCFLMLHHYIQVG